MRAHAAGKVAEMVHGERDVSSHGFTDRFAVIHGFGIGQQFQVGLYAIGNLEQDIGAAGGVGFAPGVGSGVCGVKRQINVFGGGAGSLGVDLAADRGDHVKVLAFDGRDKLAAYEVVVMGFVSDFGAGCAGGCV